MVFRWEMPRCCVVRMLNPCAGRRVGVSSGKDCLVRLIEWPASAQLQSTLLTVSPLSTGFGMRRRTYLSKMP